MSTLFSAGGADKFALVNLAACAFWAIFAVVSWMRGRVPLGRSLGVSRADNPKVFWGILATSLAVSAWTGITGAVQMMN
jgi:hypothetical protein